MHLGNSIPDAVLEFPGPKYVVVETKIRPGMCSETQLLNHYHGAADRFGEDKIFLLFLSVERMPPSGVGLLSGQFKGKVFFLSWQHVLRYLEPKRAAGDHEQRFFLEQFFAIIRAEKLWRLFSMNTDELKSFLVHFPEVSTGREAATNTLLSLLEAILARAIACSGESAEDWTSEDSNWELPCLYSALKIRSWHTNTSAYIFVNAALGKVGVILTGYQDDRAQKEKLLGRWQDVFKSAFAGDPSARTFTWAEKDEDEFAGATGYFRLIEGTAGQVFDPSKFEVFADYFYWGYCQSGRERHRETVPASGRGLQKALGDIRGCFASHNKDGRCEASKR